MSKEKSASLADDLLAETAPEAEAASMESAEKKKGVKKVVINLPLTRDNKEPLWVGVNGRKYLIRRGEDVAVPVGVAKVIQRMLKAERVAMEYEASMAAPKEL